MCTLFFFIKYINILNIAPDDPNPSCRKKLAESAV